MYPTFNNTSQSDVNKSGQRKRQFQMFLFILMSSFFLCTRGSGHKYIKDIVISLQWFFNKYFDTKLLNYLFLLKNFKKFFNQFLR